MQNIDRNFVVGSEWLYYKLYTGHKTGDVLLCQIIKPLTAEFNRNGWVDKWFFIRYVDPNYHLRIRFKVNNDQNLGNIITAMYNCLQPWIKNDLIWKIQLDTYQRELERYGPNTMELSESLFHYDSEAAVHFLDLIEGDEGEELRWLFGLRSIDNLLDSFAFALEKKKELLETYKIAFGKEFGMSRFLKKQLDDKYRKERGKIAHFMTFIKEREPNYGPILDILQNKKEHISPIAQKLVELNKSNRLEIDLDNLVGSYIHMLMNRLFKSKNRLNEMVCYDFLYRYYCTLFAISKNGGITDALKKKLDNKRLNSSK